MAGPMGEKCEDCYWMETYDPQTGICHHSALWDCNGISDRPYTWWCEHFEDRDERKRGIESIREISRRLEELREQRQVDLLDDLGIGKGKVN